RHSDSGFDDLINSANVNRSSSASVEPPFVRFFRVCLLLYNFLVDFEDLAPWSSLFTDTTEFELPAPASFEESGTSFVSGFEITRFESLEDKLCFRNIFGIDVVESDRFLSSLNIGGRFLDFKIEFTALDSGKYP